MLFGYIIVRRLIWMVKLLSYLPTGATKPFAASLNAATKPFNWANYVGPSLPQESSHRPECSTGSRTHGLAREGHEPAERYGSGSRHVLPHRVGPVLQALHDPGGPLPLPDHTSIITTANSVPRDSGTLL